MLNAGESQSYLYRLKCPEEGYKFLNIFYHRRSVFCSPLSLVNNLSEINKVEK